jgi:hypothetical protein
MTSVGIMPRIGCAGVTQISAAARAGGGVPLAVLALLVAACSFDAHYGGGRYLCSDGKCPSGQTCAANGVCVAEADAGADASGDATVDARPAALTCVDPGVLAAAGGMASGTTAGRSNTVSASCGGLVSNGPDAVYRVDTSAASVHVTVSIDGSYPVDAYLIAPCSVVPATPTCEGDMLASPGTAITVTTTFAGEHFIVVDGANAGLSGTYTLTVSVTP